MHIDHAQSPPGVIESRQLVYKSNTLRRLLYVAILVLGGAIARYLHVPWYLCAPLLAFTLAKACATVSLHGRRVETHPDMLCLVYSSNVTRIKWDDIRLIYFTMPSSGILLSLPLVFYQSIASRIRAIPYQTPPAGWLAIIQSCFAGAPILQIQTAPEAASGAKKFVFCIGLTLLDVRLLEVEGKVRVAKAPFAFNLEGLKTKYQEIAGLHKIGHDAYRAGKLTEAEHALTRAIKICGEIGDFDSLRMSLAYLGDILINLGKLHNALEYTLQSLSLAKSLGEIRGEATCWLHLGRIQFELGNMQVDKWRAELNRLIEHNWVLPYEDGVEIVADAIECHIQAYQLYRRTKTWLFAARTLGNLGMALQIFGEHELARRYHERALGFYRLTRDIEGQLRELGGIADCYFEMGHYADAVRHYEAALRLGPKTKGGIPEDLCGLALSLQKRAGIYGHTLRVKELLDRALRLANALGPLTLYVVHDRRGQVFELLQKPRRAYQEYEQSIQVIEQVRRSLVEDPEKIGFFNEQKMEVYKRIINVCHFTLSEAKEAFNYVERARSRAFLDLLERSLREAVSASADPDARWPLAEGSPLSCVEVNTCLKNV
jgi:tetratricopeptide (TPR) repeat protein